MKQKGFWRRFLIEFLIWAFFTTAVVLFFLQFFDLPLWAKILIPAICLALLPLSVFLVELWRKKKAQK